MGEDLEDEARLSELALPAMGDIDGASLLVALRGARRVQLSGLDPDEVTLHAGAAHAQADGVAFRIERRMGTSLTIVIGPRASETADGSDERHR